MIDNYYKENEHKGFMNPMIPHGLHLVYMYSILMEYYGPFTMDIHWYILDRATGVYHH